MEQPLDKAAILDKIHAEHIALETVLSRLTETQMQETGVYEGWTVKDVIAHVTAWEQRAIVVLEAVARGEDPPPLPGTAEDFDIDRVNAHFFAQNRHRPLAGVLRDFHASFRQVIAAVQSADLTSPTDANRYPWMEGRPLGNFIGNDTYLHYPEHAAAIAAWRQRQ